MKVCYKKTKRNVYKRIIKPEGGDLAVFACIVLGLAFVIKCLIQGGF